MDRALLESWVLMDEEELLTESAARAAVGQNNRIDKQGLAEKSVLTKLLGFGKKAKSRVLRVSGSEPSTASQPTPNTVKSALVLKKIGDGCGRALQKTDGDELTVGCILDEFTLHCIQYDVNTVVLSPSDCVEALDEYQLDFIFIESTWNGNGIWGNFTKNGQNILLLEKLIDAAKEKGVPVVFWNKEDPVHYDLFKWMVPLVDRVYTSDAGSVEAYYSDFGIRPEVLLFAAQPAIHNPNAPVTRERAALFAGSYYQKYRERCVDFLRLWECCRSIGLPVNIYDRNLNKSDKIREGYRFPQRYENSIRGSLAPEDVAKAYKAYLVQINLNTVKQSDSMFARRVFESLACGTPVLSNYSKAMQSIFGNIVLVCDEEYDCTADLKTLIEDSTVWKQRSDAGVQCILDGHTYSHRLKQICDSVGIVTELVD